MAYHTITNTGLTTEVTTDWPVSLETALDSDNDSVTVVNPHEAATWTAAANATAATATATQAAAVGQRHYVTMILLSFASAPAAPVAATISDGASVIGTFYLSQSAILPFARPLRMTSGNAVSVALPSGGGGVVGQVFVAGYTI